MAAGRSNRYSRLHGILKDRMRMEITRAGSKPSGKGSADWFTGTVRIDPLFTAPAPARVGGATVTFEPSSLPAVERQLDFSTGTLGLWNSDHFRRLAGARKRRTV